jgi:hypothetical protein
MRSEVDERERWVRSSSGSRRELTREYCPEGMVDVARGTVDRADAEVDGDN